MAKKKKRKETKPEKTYLIEIKGIILLLIMIVGLCPFGIANDLIKGFSAFMFGSWYLVLLLGFGLCGIYMIIKRETPNFLTSKIIGLYLIVLGLLVLSHTVFLKQIPSAVDLIKTTIDNLMGFINNTSAIQGGGILGALFGILFKTLFTLDGTKVVCYVLIICGIIMFTGVSIYDSINYIKEKINTIKNKQHDKKAQQEIKAAEEEFENDKLVVSSLEKLKKPDLKEIKEDTINTTGYVLPSLSLLSPASKNISNIVKENKDSIKTNIELLEKVINDFGIEGKIVAANIGPAVTQYEMNLKSGTKVSKILGINREIALSLGAKDVRIQAPIPGKKTVGIEIPNKKISPVVLREILESKANEQGKLMVALGRDIMGNPIHCEINKTPHLLVAGATGSGKSVCINSMLVSILMRTKPDQVKLVLIDPKKVELSIYNGVPHLLTPVVTNPKKANIALQKIVSEMERRYDIFEESGTKNIAGYNKYLENKNKKLKPEEQIKYMPYIVVVIDELADLMLVAAKEVEDSIMRITQMARAAGIHLIVATQRPSTDVITGVVKANIPSRISFAVSSNIDSRTILGMSGAEKLLGKGDMLFLPQGENTPIRVQGNFISDADIKKVVDYTIKQQKARYDETFLLTNEEKGATSMVDQRDATEEPLYDEIVEFVVTQGKASASLLQRRFRLGYNRAARAMDLLEERGIVGPQNGSKPREILVKVENNQEKN